MRFTQYLIAAGAAVSSVYAGLEDAKYSTKLSAANFDSAISGKGALVAFFAPWCGHCKSLEPTWTNVAKAFEDEENVIVGHLDADNEQNRPVASRYGVKGYPTIMWFPADGSAPVDYQSARSEAAFLEFINQQSGTHRTAGGVLNDLAGRIPNLDEVASSFLSASSDARASILAQANELASQFTAKTGSANATAAAYYLKVLNKLSESNDWAHTELARLQKLATKRGTMAGKQLDDLQIRQNILAAFTAARASASSVVSGASASFDSVTSSLAGGASSVSGSVAGAATSVGGAAVSAASSASANAASAASSVSANAANAASSVYGGAAGAASSVSRDAQGQVVSASGAAASAASSVSASVSPQGVAASQSAQGVVNDAYASGASVVGQASRSVESAASAVSASVDSAASAASSAAVSGYHKVAGEL